MGPRRAQLTSEIVDGHSDPMAKQSRGFCFLHNRLFKSSIPLAALIASSLLCPSLSLAAPLRGGHWRRARNLSRVVGSSSFAGSQELASARDRAVRNFHALLSRHGTCQLGSEREIEGGEWKEGRRATGPEGKRKRGGQMQSGMGRESEDTMSNREIEDSIMSRVRGSTCTRNRLGNRDGEDEGKRAAPKGVTERRALVRSQPFGSVVPAVQILVLAILV